MLHADGGGHQGAHIGRGHQAEFVDYLGKKVTNSLLAEATYMGSNGNYLRVTQNIDQPAPGAGTPAAVNARRPFPAYGSISMLDAVGISHYNSLQAKLQQRYKDGLTFTVAYIFSHSLDDVGTPTNAYDRRTARGSSTFDVRQRVVISPVYELPFGAGRTFANRGALTWIAGGWQLSPLVQWQTGNPLTAAIPAALPTGRTLLVIQMLMLRIQPGSGLTDPYSRIIWRRLAAGPTGRRAPPIPSATAAWEQSRAPVWSIWIGRSESGGGYLGIRDHQHGAGSPCESVRAETIILKLFCLKIDS